MSVTASGSAGITSLISALEESEKLPRSPWIATACVTIVEAHVDRAVKRLVDLSGLGASTFGSALLNHAAQDFSRTWQQRFDWLDKGFNVRVAGDTATQELDTTIELRNAIVHGNMLLTEIQVAKLTFMIDLKRRLKSTLNVDCVGREIHLAKDSVSRVANVGIRFIRYFDGQLLKVYPRLDVQ